jgi:hypothetical protein
MHYEVAIDPEFQTLISPLAAEERAQLEANLLAEGCRDPLVVWEGEPPARVCSSCPPGTPITRATSLIEGREGTVIWLCGFCNHGEPRPWILLDGHTRHEICLARGLPFEVREVEGVRTRAEVINWIINHQLGRRNLSPEQMSYLRGKRYNVEKQVTPNRAGNNQHQGVEDHSDPQPATAERLAKHYGVGEATIKRDGQFALAVDQLATTLGPESRQEILAGDPKLKKRQVVSTAKRLRGRQRLLAQARAYSFMQGWKVYQKLDALDLLSGLPSDEHGAIDSLLDQPALGPAEAREILRRLRQLSVDARQTIYRLHASADPRDRSLALLQAAPEDRALDPQLIYLDRACAGLTRAIKWLDIFVEHFPQNAWASQLQSLSTQLAGIRDESVRGVQVEIRQQGQTRGHEAMDEVDTAHRDRHTKALAPHIPETDAPYDTRATPGGAARARPRCETAAASMDGDTDGATRPGER